MDYEFLRDITGVVKVRMSMGHEAVGHWFNEEVKENLSLLDEVEQAAKTVKGSERSWQRAGHEYTLWMDGEEVMVRANQLEFSGDEMEEGMSYYDDVRRRGFPSGGKCVPRLYETEITDRSIPAPAYSYTAGILRP